MQDNPRHDSAQALDLLIDLPSPLDRELAFTRFPDQWAKSKKEHTKSLRQIAAVIREKVAEAKSDLPWIKLATFGEVRSDKGCLRHNPNVQAVTGIEIDYDGEQVSPEVAAKRLRKAGIAALIYTSASHTPEAPRWRVLAPLSRAYAPDEREAFCARLNGALGGIAAEESFKLSLSFYYGSVTGKHPVQTLPVDGGYLDLVEGVAPLGKDGQPYAAQPAPNLHSLDELLADAPAPVDWAKVQDALSNIRPEVSRDEWRKVGGALHDAFGGSDEGFEVWREWSEAADYSETPNRKPFDPKTARKEWDGFADGHFSIGSLFHLAAKYRQPLVIGADDFDDPDGDDLPLLIDEVPAKAKTRLPAEWRGFKPVRTSDGDLVVNLPSTVWGLGVMLEAEGMTLRHNEFTRRDECNGIAVDDPQAAAIRARLQSRKLGLARVGKETCDEAIGLAARGDRYHPVRDMLGRLQWDGLPKLDTFLPRYFGTKDDAYTRAVGRAFLIAMVARVMRPGCKHDCALTLIGGQGVGKSTAAAVLAGCSEWFSDSLPSITDDAKEAKAHLPGKWVVELGEMSSLTKAGVEAVKAFLAGSVDDVRLPYARRSERLERECVFIATSNNAQCLRDESGNRRFWPVEVGTIDLEVLRSDRDQLLAEALQAYRDGEQWWLTPEQEGLARVEQEAARERDVWEEPIHEWLEKPVPVDGADPLDPDAPSALRERVKMVDLLRDCLDIEIARQGRTEQIRAASVLRSLGWKRKHEWDGKWWVRE